MWYLGLYGLGCPGPAPTSHNGSQTLEIRNPSDHYPTTLTSAPCNCENFLQIMIFISRGRMQNSAVKSMKRE
jgi:hypothetical protein